MRQSRENRFCLFLLLLILINVFDNVNADSSGTVGRNRRTGNLTDMCAYRETQFPGKIFLLHASWGCYRYTRDDMFVGGIIPVRGCIVQDDDESRTNYTAPGVLFNGICTPFSHTSEVINTIVTNSFQNENMVQRWIDCTEDALDCCKTVLSRHNVEGNYCAATWDAWTCYEPAEAGTNVKEVCSTYSYIALPPRCLHYSHKQCYLNGTWNSMTDYSTCSITPRLIARTNWHTVMLSLSLIIGTPAVILLVLYRGPQLKKLVLIRNLIAAIVIRNCLVLISKQVIIMEEMTAVHETIMSRNEWTCKMLTFFEKLATNLVFACMLLEGIFLHKLLTNVFAFREQMTPAMMVYYVVVGGVSIIAALSWAVVMALTADEFCWLVTDGSYLNWINDAPKLIMLITCTVLLCHIIFTIWKSLTRQENGQLSSIRTAKVSLLCMPLFGIPFLFFIVHPETDSCDAEQIFYYCSYAFEGLQGVFVSILHCYIDKEVQKYYTRRFRDFIQRIDWTGCGYLSHRFSGNANRKGFSEEADVRQITACTTIDDNVEK